MNWFYVLIALIILSGCGGVPFEPRSAPQLPAEVTARGETVYFGSVFPLESAASAPTYVYERRVEQRDGRQVSTHITREPSGATARAESATEGRDHALLDYTLHADQLGRTGSVRVEGQRITFRLVDAGGQVKTRVEETDGDVAVGPTLVGYIVRHLDTLRAGKRLAVRLAVLDRLETLGFELWQVGDTAGQTRVRMTPSNVLVGLVVEPIYFTFDAATGKLLRLEGRVPPMVREGERWSDFDARVEYRFVAASYR